MILFDLIFAALLKHFHASYFNKLLLQILHHRLHIVSVSSSDLVIKDLSYQKLSPTFHLVGVVVQFILKLGHKASSSYDVNIQFCIYTKFLTHVEGVSLNRCIHAIFLTFLPPFWPFLTPRTLMKSSHRFTTTDFTFTQSYHKTLNMESHQKLLPMLYLVGIVIIHWDASPWSMKSI